MKMRRIAGLALLAMLIVPLSAQAITFGPWINLRPKMTLAASSTDSVTPPIRIQNARSVTWLLRSAAAETDSLTDCHIDLSSDGVNWIHLLANGVSGAGATQTGGGTGRLGKPGRLVHLQSNLAGLPALGWAFARLRFNTTAQIDSLAIDAMTVTDGSNADLNRQPPVR